MNIHCKFEAGRNCESNTVDCCDCRGIKTTEQVGICAHLGRLIKAEVITRKNHHDQDILDVQLIYTRGGVFLPSTDFAENSNNLE